MFRFPMQETVPEDTSSDPDYFAGEAVLVEGEGGAQGENIEDAMKEEVATEAPVHTTVPAQQTVGCTSHVKNPAIPAFWRYGIVVYLLVIFCILVACDVGSGVSAEYVLLNPDGTIFKQRSLFHVSIFTSVKKLWNTGSYPLAIFIVLTSISWPFVKLGLSLFSWVTPFTNVKRRERLLEVIDMLGKWSFVDIFVLLIIMVAFRSNLELGFGVVLEIVIVPRWGLYGFVAASMLSILGTHKILFFHRRLQYHNEDGSVKDIITETDQLYSSPEKDTLAKETKVSIPVILALLISSCALLIAAFAIDIYEVTAERPEGTTSEAYSILRVGLDLPPSALEPNSIGTRWIQLMFFLFLLAFPMCNVLLFGTLYLYPMTKALRERVFLLAEISFSWTCVEVFMGSAIFSVLQIPKFGNGLIDAGCPQCFKVGSKILPAFSILVIASVVQISVNVWLFRKAHRAVYPMVQS